MKKKNFILHLVFVAAFCLFDVEVLAAQQDPLRYVVREHQGYGFINKEGKFIINPSYKNAEDFSNSLAVVARQ